MELEIILSIERKINIHIMQTQAAFLMPTIEHMPLAWHIFFAKKAYEGGHFAEIRLVLIQKYMAFEYIAVNTVK